jgi:hypothetical protein
MKISYNNLIYVLVATDVLLYSVGVIIPGFRTIGLFQYLASINEMTVVNQFLAWNWVVTTVFAMVSWIGLCCYKKWARYSYLIPLFLGSISCFVGGIYGNGPGIFDVALNLSSVFYGFFICMLYFSPLTQKFD